MHHVLRSALFVIALLALAACDPHGPYHVPMTKEKFQRWEAPGRLGRYYGTRNIYWIDNERVLFVGTDAEDAAQERSTLRIWTVSTGRVEVLGPSIGELCYFRGFVRYLESQHQMVAIERYGHLGETLHLTVDVDNYLHDMRSVGYTRHAFDCQLYDTRQLAPGQSCKERLLPGDGYVETQGGFCLEDVQARRRSFASLPDADRRRAEAELEAEVARRPVRYFRGDGRDAVSLPIEANEIGVFGNGFSYLEWKDRYVLDQRQPKGQPHYLTESNWPRDQKHNLYLLARSGELETIEVPITTKFLSKPEEMVLTRAGVVARAPKSTRDRRQSLFGLVLFREEGPEQLDDGDASQMALSPDGCRIAYDKAPHIRARKPDSVTRLRAIDLCRRDD